MPLKSTKTTKFVLKPEERKTNGAQGFFDKTADTHTKKFLTAVDKSTLTDFSGSAKTPATQRIGSISVKRQESSITIAIEDNSIRQRRYNRIGEFGGKKTRYDIKNSVDAGRQGTNVLTHNQRVLSLLPFATVNAKTVYDSQGNVINNFESFNFGQMTLFNYFDLTRGAFLPFKDFPGRLDPVHYVSVGGYYPAYMIVNDQIENYLQFNDPEDPGLDGAIDVFNARRGFAGANLNFDDIQIKGIRGSFSTGDWELSSLSDKKGTAIIDSKFEFKQASYDYFEDADDKPFGSNSFPRKGDSSSSGYNFSYDGYVSDGKYTFSPFEDKNTTDDKYTHLTRGQERDLLDRSDRDISEIGFRFKSSQNGFILRPKYENVIQNVLGTDSIAFRGLLRE